MKQQDNFPERLSGSHQKRRKLPSKNALGGTLTDKRRWISLYVLCMGMLMIVLDATVVNVALPAIQSDLGFTQSGLAWVVNAYLISFGGLLLLAGRLGDLASRKGMFLVGLAVFTVASLLCGLAQSQVLLVAARFVQGAGGAMTSAVILGMIVTMFPEPREQAKAIGVFAFVASAGGAVGLLVGGVLTQSISWHWIFFVNIPVGIATAVIAGRLIETDRGIGFRDGADVPGAVLITASLMLGVYTIVNPAAEYGWGAGRTLALGAVSLALLVAFVAREATAKNPLIPLRIFRSRNVSGANIVQVLSVAGMFGMFFLGALYLQRILGYDALQTGLAFLPVTILMGTLSVRYTDRLVMRFGARKLVLAGLALFMAWSRPVRAGADRRRLRGRHSARDGLARRRGRPLLPGAHDARDVRRYAGRCGAGLRPHQHDRAGRRRPWIGRTRDPVGFAERGPDRGRRAHRGGAVERLPSRVRHRCRTRPRGHRGRRDDPATRASV